MHVFVGMQESVANEKVENDDGDVGLEVAARQLRLDSLDRPEEEAFRLSVRVHRAEVQRKRQVETKFPGI